MQQSEPYIQRFNLPISGSKNERTQNSSIFQNHPPPMHPIKIPPPVNSSDQITFSRHPTMSFDNPSRFSHPPIIRCDLQPRVSHPPIINYGPPSGVSHLHVGGCNSQPKIPPIFTDPTVGRTDSPARLHLPQLARYHTPPKLFHSFGRSIPTEEISDLSQNYNYTHGQHQSLNLSVCSQDVTDKASEEFTWLQNWITAAADIKKHSRVKGLKLQTIQENVLKVANLICDLESLDTPAKMKASDSVSMKRQIDFLKQQISNLLQHLHSDDYKAATKQCLNDRRNMRKISKERIKKKKALKPFKDRTRAIDEWRGCLLQKKQDEEQEEKLKNDADKVLCEVRKKQEQGRKMISLLEKLHELRNTRIKRLSASGVAVSDDNSKLFDTLRGTMTEVVDARLADYQLEEKTLRVMMEKTPSYTLLKMGKMPSKLRLQDEIHKILFNCNITDARSDIRRSEESLNALVEIRNEWDKFISNSELASSIPIGWIVPPQNTSEDWRKYQSL